MAERRGVARHGVERLHLERPPRDIAIVMLSALGDAVHVLPVVSALDRAWPDARITWVIQPVPQDRKSVV